MSSSLFEAAYIRARAAVGEDSWTQLTDLQHADLICCEMYRLGEEERDVGAATPGLLTHKAVFNPTGVISRTLI